MPSINDFDVSGASEAGPSVDDFDLSSAKTVDDFDLSGAQEAPARDIRPRAAARLATLKAGGDDLARPGEGSPQNLGPRSLSELAARRKRAIPAGETNLPKTVGPFGDVGAVIGSVLGGSTEFAGAKPEGVDVVSIAKAADNPYVSGAAHWFEQPTTNFGPWAKEKFKNNGWLGELAGAGGGAVDAMTSPEMVTLFGAGPVAGLASKTAPVSRFDKALQRTVSAPGLIPHDMGTAMLGQGLASIPSEAARFAMGAATGSKADREEALAGLVPNVALAGMALRHAAAGPAPRAAAAPRPVEAPLDPRHTPPALPELPDFTAPLPQTLGPRDIPAGRPGLDFPANAPPEVAANQAPRPGSGMKKRMNAERDLWDKFQRQQAEQQAEIPQNAPGGEELAGMQPASFPVPPDVAAAAGEPRPSRRDARAAAMAAMVPEGLDQVYTPTARTPADIVLEAVGKTPPPAGGPVKSNAARAAEMQQPPTIPGTNEWAREAIGAWPRKAKKNINVFEQPPWGAAGEEPAPPPPAADVLGVQTEPVTPEMAASVNRRERAPVLDEDARRGFEFLSNVSHTFGRGKPGISVHKAGPSAFVVERNAAGEIVNAAEVMGGTGEQGVPGLVMVAGGPRLWGDPSVPSVGGVMREIRRRGWDPRDISGHYTDSGWEMAQGHAAKTGEPLPYRIRWDDAAEEWDPLTDGYEPGWQPEPGDPILGDAQERRPLAVTFEQAQREQARRESAAPGDVVRRWRQERGEPVTGENIPPDPADVVLRRFMREREQQRPPTTDPRARAIMEKLRRPTIAPPPEGPVGPFRQEVMTPEEIWQETQRANLEKDRAQATPVDPSAKFLDAIPQDQAELLRDKREILRQLEDPAMAESRGDLKNVLAEINNRLYPDAEAQLEEIRSRPRTYRPLPDRFAGLDDSLVAEAKRRESAGDETVDDSAAYSEAEAKRAETLKRKRDQRLRDMQAEAEAEARAELEGDNPVRRHVAEMESAGKSPEEIDALLKAAAESGEDFAPHAQWLLREREQRAQAAEEQANAAPPPPEFDDVPIGDLSVRDFARSGASDPEFQEYQRVLAETERLRAEAAGESPAQPPLSPRDQAVVDAAKKRKPTMTLGSGLGALGEEPGKVISDAARAVLDAARKGKSWLFDPMDPEGHAAALEQARQTVLADIRDRGIGPALWSDPRNLMKTGELGKQSLTEAERALDPFYVSGQKKTTKKTTNQKLLGVYQDAIGFNEPTRALEEITGDARPESARASGILSLPGHRGIYEDTVRHEVRDALEPIKEMPAAIDKLDRYLGSKKLLEKYNDLQRQHTESEAARAKVSAYEADKSNPKPTAREESLAARETSAPSFEDLAGEGYTMDMAQRAVAEADPRVVQAAENLGEIGRRQLQRMVDSGAISQETADKLNALYSTNAPLYRDIGGDGPAATGSRPLKSGNPLKRLTGSDRKINSPFYNWLDHQAAIERTIYLNKAKKTMLEPLIDNPEMRKAAEESGMVTFEEPSEAVDARFEERAARIKDLAKKLNIELSPEELELFSEMNDSAAGRQLPLHNRVLETRIGGKVVRARVSEELAKVYESLSSTLGHQDNIAKLVGDFMLVSAKLAHGAITSLPEFALRQIIPDQATAVMYGEKSRAPRRVGWFEALDVARGKLADAAKIEKLGYDPAAELRAYTQTGAGMTNFYGPKGQQALVREAMTPNKGPYYFTSVSDFISRGTDLMRAMEQVPTIRDYVQRRLAGDTPQDSAYNAVKTTRPNFAMYGSSSMVRALRSWTPFMGAGANGLDFTFRRLGGAELLKNMATTDTPLEALKKTVGKDRQEILRRQRKVLAGGMAIAGLTSAAFMKAWAEDDQDVLGEMRSPIGRDHLIFRPWPGADKVRIRLPETIGQIFNMYPWVDGLKGGSDDYAQRWVDGILAKAYTNVVPPAIQAYAAVKYNRASYDSKRPLIQRGQEDLLGHLQANRNDSALARSLGTDRLPAPYIDEILGIYGMRPWIEQPPVRALGNALAKARGFDMGEPPATSWSDVSPLRGFLHHPSRDTYSQGRFYENLDDLKKQKGSYDSIKSGRTPLGIDRRMEEMASLNPDEPALQRMTEDAKRIARLRELQTSAMLSTVYDADTKRALMDEYQNQMNDIARAANQQEMTRRALRREMLR